MELLFTVACVFCRLSPMTLIAPVIFFSHIPLLIRTLLTLSWSVIIALAIEPHFAAPATFEWQSLLPEFFLGVVLSLGFHAANAILHMVSQLIDIQMGISAGATFDPVNFQTTSPIGTLFSLLIVATFFGTNFHYEFLYFFGELFRHAPPMAIYQIDADFFKAIGRIFVLGFIVASPVIVVLFLVDITLALISRSMPQAQIYFVAIPLKIIIGILVLAVTINLSAGGFYQLLSETMVPWEHLRKY